MAQSDILKAKRTELLRQAQALVDGAGDNDLSAENSAKVDALLAEAETASVSIARAEKIEKALAEASVPPQRRADAGAPVRVTKENAEDDPKRGFKSPRDFFASVHAAATGGTAVDNRLKVLKAAVGSDEHGGHSNEYGGFLVPQGFSPNLLSVAAEVDPIAGLVGRIPMASPSITIPARVDKDHSTSVSGGLRVYWREQTVAATPSRVQTEQITYKAKSLMGLSYTTEELMQDSAISVMALLEAGFRDEYPAAILASRLSGTGVGEPVGVIGHASTVSVTKETGQAAATITFENVVKMYARCWRPGAGVWLANHNTIPQLAQLSLGVGTGGQALFVQSAAANMPSTLFGRPIYFTEFCPTVGTVGDIIFANWSQYLEGVYQPLKTDESIHVRFDTNEHAFRFSQRMDGGPWWRSPLTPKNGSTLSPFVTLATRA